MDNGNRNLHSTLQYQPFVLPENSILEWLLKKPSNSTSLSCSDQPQSDGRKVVTTKNQFEDLGHQKSGSMQKLGESQASADLHPSTLQLTGDFPNLLQKPLVVSDSHAVPDCEHALQWQKKPVCLPTEATEVENHIDVHLRFSTTLAKIPDCSPASFLQTRRPTFQQLYQESPRKQSQQHSFSGNCNALPTFQDTFSATSSAKTFVPYKKRLIENWTKQPNQGPYPAPVQRNKEHQKIIHAIPHNSSPKVCPVINKGYPHPQKSSASSQDKGYEICNETCYSQNSLITQLQAPPAIISPEPARMSIGSVSTTSGHTCSTADFIGKCIISNPQDKSDESSSSLEGISHSITYNVKMSDGRYPEESDIYVQKVLVPAVYPGISPSSSSQQKVSSNCQTRNVEQRKVSRRPNTYLKATFSVNNEQSTNILSRSDGMHGQSELHGSCSSSLPVRDIETNQPEADVEIMFGFPTNIDLLTTEACNSLVLQNPGDINSVPLDLRVNKHDSRTILYGSATEEQTPFAENYTKKEPNPFDKNGTEMDSGAFYEDSSEKESRAYIENGTEKDSGESYENDIEKESRAYAENGSEKPSGLSYDSYSENRSNACHETNYEKDSGACDKNYYEKGSRACDETDLWEAFEMDEEGLRELGNNIKGLEDIMEYLAGSDETCNQSGDAEIASSARRKTKNRDSSHRQGERYSLRSKIDLSRMMITRSQKRSGKSKVNDPFCGVRSKGRHSGSEKHSGLGYGSYSENRSNACRETNNKNKTGACDKNYYEKGSRAYDETDLWEAFEMDEEGSRELGNNTKGLEDIMEYLAGSDETCNQSGDAEIASSARRKTKNCDSSHRQGERYSLRSKIDLSRMMITRSQKHSGKSKVNDAFCGVRSKGRHSARASNSRRVNTSWRLNKSSCKANTYRMKPKDAIPRQLHTKKIKDRYRTVPANSSNNLLIRIQVDKGTGEINTEQKVPEYCPVCLELLCPSRFTVCVHNFSLKTVCVGCGSAIFMIFEPVSYSCVEIGRTRSKRKSKGQNGW